MTLHRDVVLSILTMDSYNRAGVGFNFDILTNIGEATFLDQEDAPNGFYASAYLYNGERIVSYRGTDFPSDFGELGAFVDDVVGGWINGAGAINGQALQAADFYNVTSQNGTIDTVVVGHSLGGGLAGFVGNVYQTEAFIVDAMPYAAAVAGYYLRNSITPPSNNPVRHVYVDGEIVETARDWQGELPELIYGDVEGPAVLAIMEDILEEESAPLVLDAIGVPPGLSALALHSVGLQVILTYAHHADGGPLTDWMAVGQGFIEALYNDAIATIVTENDELGRFDDAQRLQQMLGYSALDAGNLPFGDTGIRALFNDAEEVGAHASSESVAGYSEALALAFVQYAGHLASSAIVANELAGATDGVIEFDETDDTLIVSFDDEVWSAVNDEDVPDILARSAFLEILSAKNQNGLIETDIELLWREHGAEIDQVIVLTSIAGSTVSGGEGNDLILGAQGNDDLFGSAGLDLLAGGSGDDYLHGGSDVDFLFGGVGNDTLEGGEGSDRLDGGAGDDVLLAGDGEDELIGGSGFDQLRGGAGDDTIRTGSDGDVDAVYGEGGADHLIARGGVANLYGKDGTVVGGSLSSDGDHDLFEFGGGLTFIHDADGDDYLSLAGLRVVGGVQQWWNESGMALWSPVGSLAVAPVASANFLFSLAAATVDGITSSLLQYRMTESGQLEILVLGGRGGRAVIEGYELDLESGAASGNVVAFMQRIVPGGVSLERFAQYMNLALRAGFGVCTIGVDPLILDLDGDGVELTHEPSTYFDMNADGWAERTAWTRGGDGFLVRDLNSNGSIDNINEMFGDESTPGLTALAAMDTNTDGKISALDTNFLSLRVWVDADGDGVTDAGELKTLAELGITEISTTPTGATGQIRGNIVQAQSTFVRNGNTHVVADVLLNSNTNDTKWLGDKTISGAAEALPELKAFGLLTDLRVAMSDDATLLSAVSDFAAMSSSTDWATLSAAVEDILFRWAGVDGLTATAMTANFDEQKLAFLEAWFGTEMTPRNVGGDPLLGNVAELIEAWDATVSAATIRLAAQGPLSTVLTGVSYDVGSDRLEAASATTLEDAIHDALLALPGSSGPALISWNDHWAPLFQAYNDALVREDGNIVRTDFVVMALIAAMDGVSQPLTLSQLVAGLELQNVLVGGGGTDSLTSTTHSATVFVGDGGNDTLTGNGGQSIYVYGAGFGQDTIIDFDARELGDRIRFALHEADDVAFARNNLDLVISVIGSTDKVTVKDYFKRPDIVGDYGVEEIQFADGSILLPMDIVEKIGRGTSAGETLTGSAMEDILEGLAGNDTLRGGDGGDIYIFSAGHGQDIIEEIQTTPLYQTADALLIESGYGFDDIIFSRVNDSEDLVITFEGGADSILVKKQFAYTPLGVRGANSPEGLIGTLLSTPFISGAKLALESRIDQFLFGEGGALGWQEVQRILIEKYTTDAAETTYGFGAADVFNASAGDDTLIGFDGSDTYWFDRGSGDDTIADGAKFLTLLGTDVVKFGSTVSLSDVVFSRIADSDDLLVSIVGSGDTLTIIDQFAGKQIDLFGIYGVQWFGRVEKFEFAGGLVVTWEDVLAIVTTGTSGEDELIGDFYKDTLDGGAGADFLDGRDEGDTYKFGIGDGDDVIHENPDYWLNPSDDMVLFKPGIAVEDVTFTRVGESMDLLVTIDGVSDTLLIKDQYVVTETGPFGPIASHQIEKFKWADGTTVAWADLVQAIIDASKTSGADTIVGSHFGDSLDGGAGEDLLKGGNGADVYLFELGHGHDTINDYSSNLLAEDGDEVAFGAGIDDDDIIITRIGDTDVVLSVAGTSDTLTIEDQFAYTTIGIRANEVETFTFDGGPIWTAEDLREHYLAQVSTSGNDTVEGFFSDDVIDGEAGDDVLRGGDGSDTYVFSAGFGADTIEEEVALVFYEDFDAIAFASGYDSTDAVYTRSGDDLTISFLGSSDEVTIVGQFDHSAYFSGWTDIEHITFGDSVVVTDAGIREALLVQANTSGNDTIEGFYSADTFERGAGNDILRGVGGGDTYRFGKTDGQDTIEEDWSSSYEDMPDTVEFDANITRAEVTFSRVGDDLVASITGVTDTLTIKNHFLSHGRARVEFFKFANGTTMTAAQAEANAVASLSTSGADTINGTSGADLLDGGAGNDVLKGAQGNDTYVFGLGYGQDRVEESSGGSASTADRVIFREGIGLSDLVLSRTGNDLIIDIAGTSDRLTVKNQFYTASSSGWDGQYRIDTFQFADGRILSGVELDALTLKAIQTSGNDTIVAFSTADVLDGGAGNDSLKGGEGNDTYKFGRGYGQDSIDEMDATHGDLDDVMIFAADVAPEDLVLTRSGNNITIAISGTSDQVTILDQVRSTNSESLYGTQRIERFVFANGVEWSAADLDAKVVAAQQTAGNDVIYGYDGEEALDGGAGNDTLQGNLGADLYIFGRGYGQDVIDEQLSGVDGSPNDTVAFKDDVAPEDIQLSRSGLDLIIKIAGTTDQLRIQRQFWSIDSSYVYGVDRVESFVFADGTVWSATDVENMTLQASQTSGNDTVLGYESDDVLDGGAGNDFLQGDEGADLYLFGRGSGQDTLNETTQTLGDLADKLAFKEGVALSDLQFSRTGNDLIIAIVGTSDQITIKDQLRHTNSANLYGADRVETFAFADGSSLSAAEVDSIVLLAHQTPGADEVRAYETIDTLDGGAGNDTLRGLRGDDTYVFGRGYGQDIVNETNGTGVGSDLNDRLVFRSDTLATDVVVTRSGNDVIMTIAGTSDQVTLKNQLYWTDSTSGLAGDRIERIEFADGTFWTGNELDNKVLWSQRTSGNDTITAFDGAEILDGGAGNDTLNGAQGADILRGDIGTDTMTGGSGADKFDFNALNESVVGTSADKITDFAKGSDLIDLIDIDANTGAGGDQAFSFIGASAFSNTAGEMRATVSGSTTTILGDVDGDGIADFQITLQTAVTLASNDFLL